MLDRPIRFVGIGIQTIIDNLLSLCWSSLSLLSSCSNPPNDGSRMDLYNLPWACLFYRNREEKFLPGGLE